MHPVIERMNGDRREPTFWGFAAVDAISAMDLVST
jgi:hypothetical protein